GAVEQDLAGVGLEMRADQVDQRGLAGAVRADERQKLALVDGEIDVVAGLGLAELLPEVDGLQQDHDGRSFGWNFLMSASSPPTMPVGSRITIATSTTPSRSCQYSVVATA